MSLPNIGECSICQYTMTPSRDTLEGSSNCTHVFHKDCIVNWISENQNCPNCRLDWSGLDYPAAQDIYYRLLSKTKKISHKVLDDLKGEWDKVRSDCSAAVSFLFESIRKFNDYNFNSTCLKSSIILTFYFSFSRSLVTFLFGIPWTVFLVSSVVDRCLKERNL